MIDKEIRVGERIAKLGKIKLSCNAAVFDGERRILLTKRADNGLWCVPGGAVDPGETVKETCEREVLEETGLIVRVERLIGVYSNTDWITVYPDSTWQYVELFFLVRMVGGKLCRSDEAVDARFCTDAQSRELDLQHHDKELVADAFANTGELVIR